MAKKNNSKGFTLLETLVYLGLFSIILIGIVSVSFAVFESSGRNQTKVFVQEEGNFLLAKINWALANANTIFQPLNSGAILALTKYDGSTVNMNLDAGNNLQISQDGGSSWLRLNNSSLSISGLNFLHTGSGTSIESLQASFTLQAKTPTGQNYSQNFQTTKYLRK